MDRPHFFKVQSGKITVWILIMVIWVVKFSSGGIKNWKDLLLRIKIPKGNYWILRIGVVASCQKLNIILVIKDKENNSVNLQFIPGIEHENHEASPKLRSRSIFCPDLDQPMTPSSSRSCSSYATNLEGSSEPDEYNNGNSSSATIKPILLASKFDCFSDSDWSKQTKIWYFH